jgi:hypothetical protein
MINWFRKKTNAALPKKADVKMVQMQPFDYQSKIILAWAKAVEGNHEIKKWLFDNAYPELAISVDAINLKNTARDWLTENGYPHLMAFIHAAEGNGKAQKWLLLNHLDLLYHMAMAIESEDESWKWIAQNAGPEIFILTQTIKKVKDEIEENHSDVHSFNKD